MKKIIIISILLSSLIFASGNNIFKKINNFKSTKDMFNEVLLKNVDNKDDFEFILKKSIKGLSGVEYLHYKYKYKNIIVENQEIVISKKDGVAFLISGNFEVAKLKSLSSKFTEVYSFDVFRKSVFDLKFYSPVEKAIIVKNKHSYLTYKALIAYTDKKGYHLGEIYLDSNSFKIIDFHSNKYEALFRKVYTFDNKCFTSTAMYNQLPGVHLFSEGYETDYDSAALYAYNNTGITYWFYKNMLNRDSFDNRGRNLISTLHVQFYDENYGCHGQNASFMGYPFYQMVYGDGNPNIDSDDYSRGLDVVAHELTHAVTDATSDLIYRDEMGALNEAMSDIFGATTEAWSDSGGTSMGNPTNFIANDNTWKIGEKIGSVMRYMNNPALARQSQPDHYSNLRYIGTETDNGGVHVNSGIINLAYYLLVAGGKHPVRTQDLQEVEGIGLEKAIKIYYEAQIGLFVNSTNFSMARTYLAQAAENLYGVCSNESEQVNRAYDIVGVPGTRRNECIKSCDELNCENIQHSACSTTTTNSYCKCNEGFHWNQNHTTCEEDYTCYNVTCKMNNSHCQDYNGSAVCICDDGYYIDGQSCLKKQVDPCENIDCGSHGECSSQGNDVACECNPGYTLSDDKLNCIKYVNPCNGIDCSNHGNCVIKNNEALCGCFNGYHAQDLECIEDEVDLCENVLCSNHGSCLVSNNKASCVCENGYEIKGLDCIKKEVNNTTNEKSKNNSSSCNYGSSEGSSFLFLLLIAFIVIMKKKSKLI